MINKNPLVSVVIPTYNRRKSAERLVRSIKNNTYKNTEIIIIDDASTDGSYQYLSERFRNDKKLKILRNKTNLYTAESRNVGFRRAKGDFVFFIDDDNVLDKKAIEELLRIFNADNSIGELGPVNYNYNSKRKVLWFMTKRNMFTTKTSQPRNISLVNNEKTWDTDDIPNAFMVRRNVVKRNNIFFRKYFRIMYEESDFAYRIRRRGYKVMTVKASKIYHDIERREKGKKIQDYMYHFMTDFKRPYLTARNRIIFHSIYSSRLQFLFIIFIWIWLFAFYYVYKILFYPGVGSFSLYKRLLLSLAYLKGTFDGLFFVFLRKTL